MPGLLGLFMGKNGTYVESTEHAVLPTENRDITDIDEILIDPDFFSNRSKKSVYDSDFLGAISIYDEMRRPNSKIGLKYSTIGLEKYKETGKFDLENEISLMMQVVSIKDRREEEDTPNPVSSTGSYANVIWDGSPEFNILISPEEIEKPLENEEDPVVSTEQITAEIISLEGLTDARCCRSREELDEDKDDEENNKYFLEAKSPF